MNKFVDEKLAQAKDGKINLTHDESVSVLTALKLSEKALREIEINAIFTHWVGNDIDKAISCIDSIGVDVD